MAKKLTTVELDEKHLVYLNECKKAGKKKNEVIKQALNKLMEAEGFVFIAPDAVVHEEIPKQVEQ